MHQSAMQALRKATGAVHQRLEDSLHVNAPGAGRAAFLSYLAALHAWQAGFEARLWKGPWPAPMQADERSGKCAWMAADLASCGMAPLRTTPGWTPPLDSLPRRLGLAYVVEGAQLGTQVLGKRLAGQLGEWQPCWLQGYGEHTGARWRSFMQLAEELLASEDDRQQAATAAVQAFESLAAWFIQCGAASAPLERMQA